MRPATNGAHRFWGELMSDPVVPAAGETVVPPSPDQLVKVGPTTVNTISNSGSEEQRDSPELPQATINAIDDGIQDQQSRRSHRPKVVWLAIGIVVLFALNLTVVVGVMACGFWRALEPSAIAKASAAEVVRLTQTQAQASADATADPAQTSKPIDQKKRASEISGSPTSLKTGATAQPVRIEAKIYGEVRDSMVPLVALVSILTVAIVVILGTFLKAAFLANPNGHGPGKEIEASPVPVLEALKSLADSIKAPFKS